MVAVELGGIVIKQCNVDCGCAGVKTANLCRFLPPCQNCKDASREINRQNNPDKIRSKKNKQRRERDQMLRDLGLTKVRGAVSGRTYWE